MYHLRFRFLSLFLVGAMVLLCLPVSAGTGGSFYLTASTTDETILEPVAISYAPGQTIREALLASSYSFQGLDTGFIDGVQGVAGNFVVFYDNGAYDLDAIAAPETITALSVGEGELYSPEMVSLIVTMGSFREMTDHVDAYEPASLAYRAGLVGLRYANAQEAAALEQELRAAIDAYHNLLAGEKVAVTFTVSGSPEITLEDRFGNVTEAEGLSAQVIPGTYHFCVADGCNRTEGDITAEEPVTVSVTLPSGQWFGEIHLRAESGAGESDYPEAEGNFLVEDYRTKAYLNCQRGPDQPDSSVGLYPCYVGTDGKDYSDTRKAWASNTAGLTRVIRDGMEGRTIRLEARYLGADGFTQIQSRELSLLRVPTLKSLEIAAEGTVLPLEFQPDRTDYTVTTVADGLAVSAEPYCPESKVTVEKREPASDGDRVSVEVSHANGQSRTYTVQLHRVDPVTVTLLLPEGTEAEVWNAAGSPIVPFFGQSYHLVPGETYSCIATKGRWFHTRAFFTADSGLHVTVAEPDAQSHLLAFGSYSGRDVKKSETYPISQPFTAQEHEYTVTVSDANSTVYLQCTGEENYDITACYQAQTLSYDTNGADKQIPITVPVDPARSAVTCGQCLTIGGYSNRLTIRLSKTVGQSEYYQDYSFLLARRTTLSDLTLRAEDTELPLKDAGGALAPFDRDVQVYYVKVLSSTRSLTFSGTLRSTPDETKPNTGGYCVMVGDTPYEDLTSLDLPLNPEAPQEEIVVQVCHADPNAVTGEYRIVVQKTEPCHAVFTTEPEHANVFVVNAQNGRTVYPQTDGSFLLTPGDEYTGYVTAAGYVGRRLSGIIAPDGPLSQIAALEKAAENPNLPDYDAQWPGFRADDFNNGVISAPTPIRAEDAALYWAVRLGDGYDTDACGCPILVDDCIYTYSGKTIFRIHKATGEILAAGTMDHKSSFAINTPTYAEGMIFVGLANGTVQAFNAETLESLWIYSDPLGGQPNCPLVYHDGFLYTGFWNRETADANLVCLSVTDEDPAAPLEEKLPTWYYTQLGGFYWAGAYVCDDYLLVTTDDGMPGYTTGYGEILSLNPRTGAVLDSLTLPTVGDARSSVTYVPETGMAYFTTKGGYFYGVHVEPQGTFTSGSLRGICLSHPGSDSPNPAMSTSTPTVYNGRAYIGVSGYSQFGAYSGHNITVIDLAAFSVAYTVPTQGYPQTSGVLTTAYDEGDGTVYVYFFDNYTPGKLRMLKDKPGQRSPSMVTTEEGDTAYVLFTPTEGQAQYAICSPVVDADGTIYFKNDSGYLMALGSILDSMEIMTQPDRRVYHVGETFDPAGMTVLGSFTNGTQRDISEYLTFSTAPLTLDDDLFRLEYPLFLYHDENDVPGTRYHAPIGTLDLAVRSHIFDKPECTEEGHRGICAYCGENVQEYEPHSFTWVTDLEPTEYAPGLCHEECFCGYVRSRDTELPRLPHAHSYAEEVVEPTCTDQGYTLYTCLCGDSYRDNFIDALGHQWDEGIVVQVPTATQEGVVCLTCRVCSAQELRPIPPLGQEPLPFVDVREKNYFYEPVVWALANDITRGTDETHFSPGKDCTRAEVVVFLWRAAGKPEPGSGVNPFDDVREKDYFYQAVLWAVEQGITSGVSDTSFAPKKVCDRAQIVTFLWRYAGRPTPLKTEIPFTDVRPTAYYAQAVAWAVEAGITKGTSPTRFSPQATCTRGQVVTFLYRSETQQ